jgi:hypothetical protein
MTASGQPRRFRDVHAMSASLATPDILLSRSKQRSGPIADIEVLVHKFGGNDIMSRQGTTDPDLRIPYDVDCSFSLKSEPGLNDAPFSSRPPPGT